MKRKFRFTRVLAALFISITLTLSAAANAYAASVIAGKDGWYFLTYDSTIEDYQGTNLFSQEECALILQNYLNMRDTLEGNGIRFVVYLAPNKEHIYNEYMPDSYGELASYTRIDQVYDLLKDYVTVIYPEKMLREAKEKYPYDLYYRTDPHWNGLGTYLCTSMLMEELGVKMPALEDCTITPYETDSMDCAVILGEKLPDTGYTVSGYDMETDKRIIICGDSFGSELSDCLAPVTQACIVIHRDLFETDMPYEMDANVLVLEVLERYMDGMPLYTCV